MAKAGWSVVPGGLRRAIGLNQRPAFDPQGEGDTPDGLGVGGGAAILIEARGSGHPPARAREHR